MDVVENIMIWIWLGVFVITLIAEVSTQAFVSIWFSIGALVAMCICYFVPFYVEIIIFSVVSLISLLLTRPIIKKIMDRKTRYTNVDEFVGKRVKLLKDVTKFEPGCVKINDVEYQAILPEDEENKISEGSIVELIALKGNKVVVKKIKEEVCE